MADRGLPSEAPVVTTSPAGPPSDGPMQRLLASLAGLRQPPTPTAETANGADDPAFLATAKLRAAMAAFLLSGTAIAPADARACWRPLLEHLCALHRAHGLPETALLAENLPGLLVHRLVVALPEAPDQAFREMEVIKDTILAVTGSDTSHALDSAGLRTAAALGPVRVRQCAVEWIDRWQTVTKSCLAMSPRTSIEALGETSLKMAPVPLGQPSANLTTPAYSLLFPAPFVQEGLRFLALVSNRVTLFSAHLQRIDDATLTPLTRALFTLALVDEYLTTPERGAVVPPPLLAQFQHTVREIDPAIMIPPLEANKMVRSREEVRVSTALSRVSPRSACAPPGTLMARVRTDVAVFDPDVPFLSSSALAVFQPAVSSLLQLGEQPSTGAQQRLLALLQQTWTLIQNTNSPSVVINTLIDAGFTPSHCTHYLSALEGFLAAGVPARTPTGHGLGEVQQLFGCIALAGSNVFGLAREYGYYANYVKTFRRVQGASEHTHGRLCEAVGLSGGVLSQTLARIMGPAVPTEHLASLRRALVGEFETAERRFSSGQPSLLRETALIWIDVYGQTHWDITPTTPATPLSALLPVGQPSHAPSVHLAAATQIRFPALEGIHPNVLADPGFVPYVLALVVGDALRATCSAAYLPRPVEFALRVLAWARDFGLGYLPTVEGHRTKLGALITLLEPAARGGLGPTMQMADNIEQLLRELYVISRGAVEQLRPLVQLQPPPPPEVGTSLLLISMYALAARGVLQDLAERADPLIRQLEDAIVLLRLHMRTLSAPPVCGGRGHARPPGALAPRGHGGRGESVLQHVSRRQARAGRVPREPAFRHHRNHGAPGGVRRAGGPGVARGQRAGRGPARNSRVSVRRVRHSRPGVEAAVGRPGPWVLFHGSVSSALAASVGLLSSRACGRGTRARGRVCPGTPRHVEGPADGARRGRGALGQLGRPARRGHPRGNGACARGRPPAKPRGRPRRAYEPSRPRGLGGLQPRPPGPDDRGSGLRGSVSPGAGRYAEYGLVTDERAPAGHRRRVSRFRVSSVSRTGVSQGPGGPRRRKQSPRAYAHGRTEAGGLWARPTPGGPRGGASFQHPRRGRRDEPGGHRRATHGLAVN